MKESSFFTDIYQTTAKGNKVVLFNGKVSITNEYGAQLQGLSADSIKQIDDDYSKPNEYSISFTPFSIVKASSVNILLSYPTTVNPDPSTITNGCIVVAGSFISDPKNCVKIEGARLFKITNAIPAGYSGKVTIRIKLINPANNWGKIGFKIKTFENAADGEEYLVDMLESNQLIPILKCFAPCQYCLEGESKKSLDKNYCT